MVLYCGCRIELSYTTPAERKGGGEAALLNPKTQPRARRVKSHIVSTQLPSQTAGESASLLDRGVKSGKRILA